MVDVAEVTRIASRMAEESPRSVARMADGMDLALTGKVNLAARTVQSDTGLYTIDPRVGCRCEAARWRPGETCKHQIAWDIVNEIEGEPKVEERELLDRIDEEEGKAMEQVAISPWLQTVHAAAADARLKMPDAPFDQVVKMISGRRMEVDAEGWVDVVNESGEVQHVRKTCDCGHNLPEAGNMCAHVLAYHLANKAEKMMRDSEYDSSVDAPPPLPGPRYAPGIPGEEPPEPKPLSVAPSNGHEKKMPKHFITNIQGREHVDFAGLMWLAHNGRRGGITSSHESFTFNDTELSLARCTVTFDDGTTWTGSGDATPANVSSHVKPHFRRMALTRAKARALRDALGIHTAAVEEL